MDATKTLPVITTEIEDSVQTTTTELASMQQVARASEGMPIWVIILIVIGVILVLAAVAVFLVFRKKKNKPQTGSPIAKRKDNQLGKSEAGGTAKKSSSYALDKSNARPETDKLVPDMNGAVYPEITLINLSNPEKVYRARIIDKIIIGRKEGSDIHISTDAAVSSKHCVISMKGTQFYLEDCNSSNGTYYNDREVTEEIPIMSGGILEIGHDQYRLMIGK
ncbi:MAG: FHA domain-containing protein [Acetatifactor sp.]|nr:FHA domain-containing protein [Acetatifactor sp.]